MELKIKPCPFCGKGEVKLVDHTEAMYGFGGYELRCIHCNCLMLSSSPHEHYWEKGKYCTPKTERAKEKALKELLEMWNRRA